MKGFIVCCVILLTVGDSSRAAPGIHDNTVEDGGSALGHAARYMGSCFDSGDVFTCMAVKGITALNRAARSNNIELVNGVTLKRNPAIDISANSKSLTEKDITSQLSDSSEERRGQLLDLAMDAAAKFVGSHNLEVKIPSEATQEVARAIDEGRGKMKKMMGPMMLGLVAKAFAIVPLLLGGLALLTTKAIVVAKIALLLALALGGTRFFGSGLGAKLGGIPNAAAGWNYGANAGGWSGGAASYPYARSIDDNDAQTLAYAAQGSKQ